MSIKYRNFFGAEVTGIKLLKSRFIGQAGANNVTFERTPVTSYNVPADGSTDSVWMPVWEHITDTLYTYALYIERVREPHASRDIEVVADCLFIKQKSRKRLRAKLEEHEKSLMAANTQLIQQIQQASQPTQPQPKTEKLPEGNEEDKAIETKELAPRK
jgi:hypothetical protein